jgi:hypothetical protein
MPVSALVVEQEPLRELDEQPSMLPRLWMFPHRSRAHFAFAPRSAHVLRVEARNHRNRTRHEGCSSGSA